MDDFPERSVDLTFAWFGSDADVSLETVYTRIVGDEVSHSRVTRTASRHVRKRLGIWLVSYDSGAAHYDAGAVPNGDTAFVQDFFIVSLTRMLLNFHDFSLARNGEFDTSTDAGEFNARVRAESAAATRDIASRSESTLRLKRRIDEAIKIASSPLSVDALVAENYNLETGTWIGARLEQGVWYNMAVPLPLAPQLFVMHKIEFAYTRSLPCTADSTDHSCVEIVLHATPDTATLNQVARAFAPHRQLLQPYIRDMPHHFFWSTGPNHSLIESEKTVFLSGRINHVEFATTR